MTNTISEIAQCEPCGSVSSPAEVIVKKRTRRKVATKEIDSETTPPTVANQPPVEARVAPEVSSSASEPEVPVNVRATDSPLPKQAQHPNHKHQRNPQRQHNKNNQNRPAAQNNTQQAPPQPSRVSPIEWSAIVAVAQEHNANLSMFWKVLAVYETDKAYLHLVKKELVDTQLEVFEDDRVTDAVMRGARPPSIEEHWRKVYRDEMKALQTALKGVNAWISDTVPEKKHTLHWGEKISRSTNVDKDSQEFYLKKEQKKPKRQDQWRNKSTKGTARFG